VDHVAFEVPGVEPATLQPPARPSARRVTAAPVAPRHDLYRVIHAGLRLCMHEALGAVGRMDPTDPADVAAVTLRMNELIALFRGHLEKENAYIHPALEARRAGSTARIAHDHAEHVVGFARLAADVQGLRTATSGTRSHAARTLYRDLAAFVADNLVHMAAEEADHNAALWAEYTDEELAAIERAIVGSIPPAMLTAHLRWMVPANPPADRLELLRRVRAAAPAEAFDATLAMLMPHLGDREWTKLLDGLRGPG
jgi:hypothetical protein